MSNAIASSFMLSASGALPIEGLGATLSGRAVVYSANAPSQIPNTSSPD
jgi:hypothetical protein